MLDDEERARRFEALVDADPDFIAIASVDGKVDFVNRAGRRLVGFDEDADLATTSILDFLTPEGLLASVEHEQPAVVRDGHWSGTSTLRDWRDDSGIPVAVSSFLLRDVTTDEPLAMATIQRDLRESLRAAEAVDAARAALVASEQRHEALLLHMSDLVMVVSAEGDLSYASPSAGRILGHPEDWYVGQNLLDHVHTADRPTAREWLVALTGDDRSEEQRSLLAFRLRAADGSHRRYEALASNLADDETVGGVLVVVRDVTEHHEAARAQRSETRLLELIASEAPIPEVLRALAVSVEEQLDDTLCTVLLAEGPAGDMIFRHGASPGMPAGYQAALDGRSIPDDPSPCGLSARSQSPVLVADLMADDRFSALRGLAQACGVRSCWSFPVLSPRTGELLGTFALYTRAPGLPDDRIAGIIARTSWLVAITLDRQLLVAQLAHRALHDDLTGLGNRPSLLLALSASLDAAAGAPDGPGPAVVLLDLDRFKVVNDSLGSPRRRRLLVADRRAAAGRPCRRTRQVARFGGDEFVVLVRRGRRTGGGSGPGRRAARRRARSRCCSRAADHAVGECRDRDREAGSRARSTCSGTPTSRCTAPSAAGGAGHRVLRATTCGSGRSTGSTSSSRSARVWPTGSSGRALPAGRRPGRRATRSSARGAGALAAPDPRPAAPRCVHGRGRGDRPDRRSSATGCSGRPAARWAAGSRGALAARHARGQPVGRQLAAARARRRRSREALARVGGLVRWRWS